MLFPPESTRAGFVCSYSWRPQDCQLTQQPSTLDRNAQYNAHIEELKQRMDGATRSADRIREDIAELRNRYSYVAPTTPCSQCRAPLLARPFYIFQCSHGFHTDCLTSAMFTHMTAAARNKVTRLHERLSRELETERSRPQQEDAADAENGEENLADTALASEATRREIDEIVAADCVLCGEVCIKSIDEPFVTAEDAVEAAMFAL